MAQALASLDDSPGLRKLYLQSGILEKWHPLDWAHYTGDHAAGEQAQDYVNRFRDHYRPQGLGLLLWGSNGTGKTMLLNLIMKELLRSRVRVRIVSFPSVVSAYTENWRNKGIWPELLAAQVLGIEELDKGFRASNVSLELVQSALDALLRYRVQRMRPTLGTTNLDPGDFSAVYGPSITSLFKEAVLSVSVGGADQRDRIYDQRHEGTRPPAAGDGQSGLFL